MAASHYIKKDELLTYVNKSFSNINLNNIEYINDNILIHFLEHKNLTYYYNLFKSILVDSLKYLNTSKTTLFTKYWIIRGWSIEEAKEKIRTLYKHTPIFFSKDEIITYIIKNETFSFNINNLLFIEKFVNTININDHITLTDIEYIYLSKWTNTFYNSNKKNKGFILALKMFYISRGYSENEAETIISLLQKERSIRSTEYYKKRGYTEEEAKIKISEVQKNNVHKSKSNKNYWLNLGLSEEEAISKAKYYSEIRSVWSKTYWINHGFTEEEAILKIKEYNAGFKECKCYHDDIGLYLSAMNNLRLKLEIVWKSMMKDTLKFANNFALKQGWLKNRSKAECKCFDYLIKNIDSDIKHDAYAIIFPEGFVSSSGNNYFYVCDGYLLIDNDKIIIIEYDGGINIFHTKEKDAIRDNEILLLDNNVIGILHIQETLFKKQNVTDINKLINYGILKIKNCEEELVIIS